MGPTAPLIQSFGCTMAHAPFGDLQRTRPSANSSARALRRPIEWILFNSTWYLTQEGATPRYARFTHRSALIQASLRSTSVRAALAEAWRTEGPAYTSRPLVSNVQKRKNKPHFNHLSILVRLNWVMGEIAPSLCTYFVNPG
jgi:hypothetical protein